ncbi:FAR1-related protein [Corchorus olitorius]|uniref:FAR1-related protein n=1 Tax=Corchorus olitorius TaxID=93759 RepID=A0A1R3HBM4_9ROSI|nr:FAR1-related protein [Corchorus olitorius]
MEEDNNSSQQQICEVNHDTLKNQQNQSDPPLLLNIGDPHVSQAKDRKKGGHGESQNSRFKSGLDIALAHGTVEKRTCHGCGGYGHNKRSCKGKEKSTNTPIYGNTEEQV